jgi:hypothetical protein
MREKRENREDEREEGERREREEGERNRGDPRVERTRTAYNRIDSDDREQRS